MDSRYQSLFYTFTLLRFGLDVNVGVHGSQLVFFELPVVVQKACTRFFVYSGLSLKRTPSGQKKNGPLYRAVLFIPCPL